MNKKWKMKKCSKLKTGSPVIPNFELGKFVLWGSSHYEVDSAILFNLFSILFQFEFHHTKALSFSLFVYSICQYYLKLEQRGFFVEKNVFSSYFLFSVSFYLHHLSSRLLSNVGKRLRKKEKKRERKKISLGKKNSFCCS
jgi:hypothetical protein